MGKRNKKKLRRMMRDHLRQRPTDATAQTAEESLRTDNNSEKTVSRPIEIEDEKTVRSEIRKILLTILVLIMIIVGIYYINIKTDIILRTGQFAASKLNLSI